MSYVPPALRRKQEAAAKGERHVEKESSTAHDLENRSNLHSLRDIQKYFWPKWIPDVFDRASTSRDDDAGARPVNKGLEQHAQSDVGEISAERKTALVGTHSSAVSSNPDASIPDTSTKSEIVCTVSRQAATDAIERIEPKLSGPISQTPSVENNEQKSSDSADPNDDERVTVAGKERDARRSVPFDTDSVHPHNTLNSTEESPQSLQYILLFNDAVSTAHYRSPESDRPLFPPWF